MLAHTALPPPSPRFRARRLWLAALAGLLLVAAAFPLFSWWRHQRVVAAVTRIIPIYRDARGQYAPLHRDGPQLWLMTTEDPARRVVAFYKDEARLGGWRLRSHTGEPSLAVLVLQRHGRELVIGVAEENGKTQLSYMLSTPASH